MIFQFSTKVYVKIDVCVAIFKNYIATETRSLWGKKSKFLRLDRKLASILIFNYGLLCAAKLSCSVAVRFPETCQLQTALYLPKPVCQTKLGLYYEEMCIKRNTKTTFFCTSVIYECLLMSRTCKLYNFHTHHRHDYAHMTPL